MHKEAKSIDINASVATCYEAICDFASYPKWQKEIKGVKIFKKDEVGRPTIVEFLLQALLKKISYTLQYKYDDSDPKRYVLSWTYVKGDLKNIQGSYTFEEKNGKTVAYYDLEVELGIWAPAAIIETFKKVTMLESIKALKNQAEKREAAKA